MDIIVDTNALTLLVLGAVNPNNIGRHSKLSIYTQEDFETINNLITKENRLISTPNVWTEVDNLCNRVTGEDRNRYDSVMKKLVKDSHEKFIETGFALNDVYFAILGITDSILLNLAKRCDMLITGDSKLFDYARAHSIVVYDLKEAANRRLQS